MEGEVTQINATRAVVKVEEQTLFPLKGRERLPFSIVRAKEKKALRLTVWLESCEPLEHLRVDQQPPHWVLTDVEGNELGPNPGIKSTWKRNGQLHELSFELPPMEGVFRLKFIFLAAGVNLQIFGFSRPFMAISNTGQGRPEMKAALWQQLWLTFRGESSTAPTLANALYHISHALKVWQGINVIRGYADVVAYVRKWSSECTLDGTVDNQARFERICERLKDEVLVKLSGELAKLWHCDQPLLVMPWFQPRPVALELLEADGDFLFRLGPHPHQLVISWQVGSVATTGGLWHRSSLFEYHVGSAGKPEWREVAQDPISKRVRHCLVSLRDVIADYADFKHFVYLNDQGRQTMDKAHLLHYLDSFMSHHQPGQQMEEEYTSITMELDDLQKLTAQ